MLREPEEARQLRAEACPHGPYTDPALLRSLPDYAAVLSAIAAAVGAAFAAPPSLAPSLPLGMPSSSLASAVLPPRVLIIVDTGVISSTTPSR